MKSNLSIREEYLLKGITNTFFAEKAGITPAQLFGLDSHDEIPRKAVFQRIVQVLNKNKLLKAKITKAEKEPFAI